MKKESIWLVPVGGLANRMRAIDSAVALSRQCGSELHIVWFKDPGLNCRFDQLFAPIDRPGVTVTEASRLDLLRYDRPRRKNFFIPRLFQQPAFDRRMYEMDTSRRFREHFDFEAWARGHKVYIAAFVYFYEPRTEWDRFALFELYLLSHTRQVLGSVHSSYSETAAQIGHIPYELLQKKEPR